MITIRDAALADLAAVARLTDAVNALHHEHFPDVFRGPGDEAAVLAMWRERCDKGERVWVADSAVQVVGFVSATRVDEPVSALTQAMRFVRIGSIGVSAAERGGGIGAALMSALEVFARAERAVEIRLNVWDFNAHCDQVLPRDWL